MNKTRVGGGGGGGGVARRQHKKVNEAEEEETHSEFQEFHKAELTDRPNITQAHLEAKSLAGFY